MSTTTTAVTALVVIIHTGEGGDTVLTDAATHAQAIAQLLRIREVAGIHLLTPAIIETRWC